VRPQLVRAVVASGLTGVAFMFAGMLGRAMAADSANQPIVTTACSSVPKGAALLADVTALGTNSSASPSASASSSAASPTPSDSASPTPKPSSSTKKATTSASPSPSSSTSAKPSPKPSTSAPKAQKAQLCVKVQSFSSSSQGKTGQVANFAVWVWSAKEPSYGVTVTVQVAWAMYIHKPTFSICPVASGQTCKLGNVPVGQADELEVGVQVGAKAALGEQVQLTAQASAKGSTSSQGSATDVVIEPPRPSPSSTSGAPGPVLPPVSLPPISGTGIGAANPAGLFPTVLPLPSPTPGSGSLGLPTVRPRKSVRVADVAATVPLDPRLIGGQLAGLAVLAGAVAIAIARLSLRTPKAAEDKASGRPNSQA